MGLIGNYSVSGLESTCGTRGIPKGLRSLLKYGYHGVVAVASEGDLVYCGTYWFL